MRIYVAINPVSWGGKLTDRWVGKGYNVNFPSEAIERAKRDPYFSSYYKGIREHHLRLGGKHTMSFTWGTTRGTAHRHSSGSFDVPFI